MKTILSIFIIICLLFSCCACESNSNSNFHYEPKTEAMTYSYYIGNTETKKYHLPTCSYLPDPSNQVRLYGAFDIQKGKYKPCLHCLA